MCLWLGDTLAARWPAIAGAHASCILANAHVGTSSVYETIMHIYVPVLPAAHTTFHPIPNRPAPLQYRTCEPLVTSSTLYGSQNSTNLDLCSTRQACAPRSTEQCDRSRASSFPRSGPGHTRPAAVPRRCAARAAGADARHAGGGAGGGGDGRAVREGGGHQPAQGQPQVRRYMQYMWYGSTRGVAVQAVWRYMWCGGTGGTTVQAVRQDRGTAPNGAFLFAFSVALRASLPAQVASRAHARSGSLRCMGWLRQYMWWWLWCFSSTITLALRARQLQSGVLAILT